MTVSSRSTAAIRRIRALRRDRSVRDAEGVFVAEGVHLALEALASGAPIETAVLSPRLARLAEGPGLRAGLEAAGVPVEEASDAVLDGLQDARTPQPIVLVVRQARYSLEDVVRGRAQPALLTVAVGIQDPGNLGAMLRTADAAAATGFLAVGDGADLHHPRVVRATMGSIFRLPALALHDVEPVLAFLGSKGLVRVGADPASELLYDLYDLRGAVALFFGGEGGGLSPGLLRRLDGTVRIPMHTGVESLSVGAAAAVLLYEAIRQRRGPAFSAE